MCEGKKGGNMESFYKLKKPHIKNKLIATVLMGQSFFTSLVRGGVKMLRLGFRRVIFNPSGLYNVWNGVSKIKKSENFLNPLTLLVLVENFQTWPLKGRGGFSAIRFSGGMLFWHAPPPRGHNKWLVPILWLLNVPSTSPATTLEGSNSTFSAMKSSVNMSLSRRSRILKSLQRCTNYQYI